MKLLRFSLPLLALICFSCNQKKEIKNSEVSTEKTVTANKKDSLSKTEAKVEIVKSLESTPIFKAQNAPDIDGEMTDACWEKPQWQPLDHVWLGKAYTKEDFQGRYKLTWDKEALYLLVEVIDDVLFDQHQDPKKKWWDDDCVEIFVDADNSGGPHLTSHNAFAYHVALDHNVIDLSTKKKAIMFNDHVLTAHQTKGNTTIWEHKIYVFDDKSFDENTQNTPMSLQVNNNIGFALAYCDNDGSKERENFIGSTHIPGKNKNIGYKNADIFETITLIE